MHFSYKLLSIVFFATGYMAHAQNSGYHTINKFPIGGNNRWDYIAICPVNNNIYVSHQAQVNILDKNTGDSVGIINNTEGIHGIAFAPGYKKGFTSNGKINTVTVFNINTNAVLAQIKTGDNPDAIMYDEFSAMVYVCNGHSKDLTVIDPANNDVVKTIDLGGKPETAVSDNKGMLYINIEDKNEIAVVNTKTYKVEKRWKTGTGESPAGLAIDLKTKRLFAGCENKLLIVMNADNGKIVKELPIGQGSDGVAFDPELNYIFSSNGEGTLTVIEEHSANDYEVKEHVPTKKSARTLTLDQKTHKLYLPAAEPGPPDPANPKARPASLPGSFQVLVMGK